MTFAFSKDIVRKAISAHSALGLVCCALLYLICATGTAIVLYEEFQRLEQLDAPEMSAIDAASVQRGIENVLASEKGKPATTPPAERGPAAHDDHHRYAGRAYRSPG